jgi:hypothetical protein
MQVFVFGPPPAPLMRRIFCTLAGPGPECGVLVVREPSSVPDLAGSLIRKRKLWN